MPADVTGVETLAQHDDGRITDSCTTV